MSSFLAKKITEKPKKSERIERSPVERFSRDNIRRFTIFQNLAFENRFENFGKSRG